MRGSLSPAVDLLSFPHGRQGGGGFHMHERIRDSGQTFYGGILHFFMSVGLK